MRDTRRGSRTGGAERRSVGYIRDASETRIVHAVLNIGFGIAAHTHPPPFFVPLSLLCFGYLYLENSLFISCIFM
jgi:hypothetical protein